MSAPGPADELQTRLVKHIEQIAEECEYFDLELVSLRLDGWVEAWADSGSREQGRSSRVITASYERIVNDIQEMFETIEFSAAKTGLVPEPTLVVRDRAAWWAAAEGAGLPVQGADRTQGPGRWRRLAFYGHISHDTASNLKVYCDVRQLFQHGYAQRQDDSDRAAETWDSMTQLRGQLSQVLEGLERFELAALRALG